MKYLILLQCVPGSGKNSYIPEKYKDLVIEPDKIRTLSEL